MNTTEQTKKDFYRGLKRGLPIAIGYIPVSFSFGLMAVSSGIPLWLAVFISMSNLTSAGQFAGTRLILAGGGYFEIALTTFVINIRYMLMSLSLSQKLSGSFTLPQRLAASFGVTDEIFTMASMEPGRLTFPFMAGLIAGPFLGWSAGTLFGGLICAALPEAVSSAMGIALYGMFIAIIIPPARKSQAVVVILTISVAVSCILFYVPVFRAISSGFRVIIATVIGASAGALLYPAEEAEEAETAEGAEKVEETEEMEEMRQAVQIEKAERTGQAGTDTEDPEESGKKTEGSEKNMRRKEEKDNG